jgi:hypothetical protein
MPARQDEQVVEWAEDFTQAGRVLFHGVPGLAFLATVLAVQEETTSCSR